MSENDKYNCFISYCEDKTNSRAQDLASSGNMPLAGVRVAVDDNILVKDVLSTAGSKMLYNFRPPFGATIIDKALNAGAIIAGKTNIAEFGLSDSTESSFKGVTQNPVNDAYPSTGTAAAIKAGIAQLGFGSDTTGSARRLATETGICFIKPTYGTVSRFGLSSTASSMEQIGVYANTTAEAACCLSVISGHDKNDGTSYTTEKYEYNHDTIDFKSLKIGVPTDLLKNIDKEYLDIINGLLESLKSQGVQIEQFDLPLCGVMPQVQTIIASAETGNNLSRFDGVKYGYRAAGASNLNNLYIRSRAEGFGFDTKFTVALGAYVLSEGKYGLYYDRALKIRRLILDEMNALLKKYDCIIAPLGVSHSKEIGTQNSLDESFENLKFAALSSLTGFPALSLPYGKFKNGLYSGVQIIAQNFAESKLFAIGEQIQNNN